jgi:hypothetical protein
MVPAVPTACGDATNRQLLEQEKKLVEELEEEKKKL